MACLAVRTAEDGLIGAIAPLGLAAAAGTALVIDLDPGGPRYAGDLSLAELVGRSPRLSELEPGRSGVAVLRNGGVPAAQSGEVVRAFMARWPRVVLRLGSDQRCDLAPVVPVSVLLPGPLFPAHPGPAVYQATGWARRPPGRGPVLPAPRASTIEALLMGRLPRRDPWVKAWRPVWGYQWS